MMNQSALILRMALLLLMMMMNYGTDAEMQIIPSNPDVKVGEKEILLLCKAGAEGEIRWEKDGEEIEDENKEVSKVDETASKLFIRNITMADAGRYTCLCDFDGGDSGSVHAQVFVYEGPSFGNTPTYHEFLEGTDAVVPCVVTGQPAVDTIWLRHKEEISSNRNRRVHRLPDNTLFIEKIRREDSGTYLCHSQIKGKDFNKQLPVSVVVNSAPTAHMKEKVKKVIAGPETNVTLLCLVDGQPKPNITWIIPEKINISRHYFNSDGSELTIRSVSRDDYGEYVCTAKNKISETSASIELHVVEAPEVFLSVEQLNASVGERVSVFCNVSGHPQPELHWLKKHNGHPLDTTSGRVRVADGELVIDDIVPSDGGLYSCMAVSPTGNASRDVAVNTQPGPPHYMSVSPGPTSVLFSLKTSPINGGTPITSYALQWRESAAEEWKKILVPASGPLVIGSLKPYTLYTVRLAALNAVGLGQFSETNSVRTQGIREPDSPVLSTDEAKVEGNSVHIPLKQLDDGGTPLLHFDVRYKQDREKTDWKEMHLTPDADAVSLQDLSPSDYQMEVTAVNANGSSRPAVFNFTITDQAVKANMTKGSVIGIVVLIFLVVFLVVDATCCYRNRCGLLMTIAVKLFGQKVPGLKMLGERDGVTNGEVKLKGISTPRGSFHQADTNNVGQLTEVTCDKAHLTKNEKIQPDRHLPMADA